MMEFLKRIFYKTVYVENQLFRKPRKNEIGIVTIPNATPEDIYDFVKCWNLLKKNPKHPQVIFTDKYVRYVIVKQKDFVEHRTIKPRIIPATKKQVKDFKEFVRKK